MKRVSRFLGLAASCSLALSVAHPGEAEASPSRKVFALIVTNNHSAELGRPELRYADDDGAKYLEVFRMITDDDRVHLLTELDADSARLFPDAQARARRPTKAEVSARAAQIARAVGEARRAGDQVDFYFVFAGHGDVERGKGFLELRDGRLTADDVEALLKSIPATRSHVILDSCNSFFVLNARKPGGRRVAVTAEAARSLSDRLPNVGVFLSTSAEAEVFEWSELQAGIFSHAVRSGLLGGADVNGDGDVTYDELRGFINVASSSVKNPLYRPQVFARGPGGSDRAPLFPVARAKGVRLELNAAPRSRLTVRDGDGLPWIDVHKEEGAAVTLRLPSAWAARATAEERATDPANSRVVQRYTLESAQEAEPVRLATLTPLAPAPTTETRGPNDMLRLLFAAPFGPRALLAYKAAAPEASESVYGISRDDADRMRQLLSHAADIDRSDRTMTNALRLGLGSVMLAGSIASIARGSLSERASTFEKGLTYELLGGGVLGVGLGTRGMFFQKSEGEKLYNDFVVSLGGSSVDVPRVVAESEARLFKLADDYRFDRKLSVGLGIGAVALGSAALIANELVTYPSELTRSNVRIALLAPVGLAGALTTYLLFPTPIERIAELWANDPSLVRLPRLTIAPIQTGWNVNGAMVGVSGVF